MPFRYVIPGLAVYCLVVIYPSVAGAAYAFTDWSGLGGDIHFVGLDNFYRLFGDQEALSSIRNTLLLAFSLMVGQNVIGLLLALALNTHIKSRNFLRTLFFAPAVLPPVIVGFLWKYLYAPGGPIDTVLEGMHLGFLQQNWLGDPSFALWSIVIATIWQHAGLSMVIFLAGLQGVPDELLEAGEIDGAGAFRRFWNITLPMLTPATTIALVLTLINGLKLFDQVFVITGGGPGDATQTLSVIMYKEAFVLNDFSYGTTIAVVLAMIVAFMAFLQLKALNRFGVET